MANLLKNFLHPALAGNKRTLCLIGCIETECGVAGMKVLALKSLRELRLDRCSI